MGQIAAEKETGLVATLFRAPQTRSIAPAGPYKVAMDDNTY